MEECTKCELCDVGRNQFLTGEGSKNPRLMIVADYPRMKDDRRNQHLVSDVGEMFRTIAKNAKLDISKAYLTYAVRCRPHGIEDPSKESIQECFPLLEKEITKVKPEYVLILGSMVAKRLTGKNYKDTRGKSIKVGDITYFVTDSPANTLKKPSKQLLIQYDLEQLQRLIAGDLDEDDVLNWELADTPKKFKRCLDEVSKEKKALSWDIETTGLDWNDPNKLLGTIGIGISNKQWIIPFNHPDSPWSFKHDMHKRMVHRLVAATKNAEHVIMQNGKFDNKFVRRRYGISPKNTFDTMLASYVLDENSPNGLKELSKRYCNAQDYAIDTTKIVKYPLSVVAKYNAYDVYYTRKLFFIFKEELAKDKPTERVFYNLLVPVSECFENAEMNGVYLDMDKFEINEAKIDQEIAEYATQLRDMAPQVLNWNSTQQVAKYLFGDLGLPILEKTAKGLPSTSGETVLPRLRDKHPVVGILLDYREKIKLKQFLVSWKSFLVNGNYMHPNFKIHGTVTGRISCVDPKMLGLRFERIVETSGEFGEGLQLVA